MPFCLEEASEALNQFAFHEWAARVGFNKEGLFQAGSNSETLLGWAVGNGHLGQINHFLATQNQKLSKSDFMRDQGHRSPLQNIAATDHLPEVAAYLASIDDKLTKADVMILNSHASSALHIAAGHGKLPQMNAALAFNDEKITKADLMALNERSSPLGASICLGQLKSTADFLAANGEPLARKDFQALSATHGKWTGFHDAALSGSMDQAQQILVANGEIISPHDLLLKDSRGYEVVTIAIENGHSRQIFSPQFFAGRPADLVTLYEGMPRRYRSMVDKDALLGQIERGEPETLRSGADRFSLSAAGWDPPVTIISVPGVTIIIPDKTK